MCMGCWLEHGGSEIVNDKVRRAAELIGRVFDLDSVGDCLHVAIEDWNLAKKDIRWCLTRIKRGGEGFSRVNAAGLLIERELAELLLEMPI